MAEKFIKESELKNFLKGKMKIGLDKMNFVDVIAEVGALKIIADLNDYFSLGILEKSEKENQKVNFYFLKGTVCEKAPQGYDIDSCPYQKKGCKGQCKMGANKENE